MHSCRLDSRLIDLPSDVMAEGSVHPDTLSDNIRDALDKPGCCNWQLAHGLLGSKGSMLVRAWYQFSGGRFPILMPYFSHSHACPAHVCLGPSRGCTFHLVVAPLGVPIASFEPICGGLHVHTEPYHESPRPVTGPTHRRPGALVHCPCLGGCPLLAIAD